MTNHAKDAAEKVGRLFAGMPGIMGMAVAEAAEPIIKAAIDAATAPLREEIERLKLARDEAYERAAKVAASAAEIERVVGRKACAELVFAIAETIREYSKGDHT